MNNQWNEPWQIGMARERYSAAIHGDLENGTWDIQFPSFGIMAAFVKDLQLEHKTTVFMHYEGKKFNESVLVNINFSSED